MPEKPLSVLLLCEDEAAANMDRRALRSVGITDLRVMTSGIAAARLLAGMDGVPGCEPDMVVCLRQLEDMDGEQFCAIIRQHPRLLGLPILLILANESEAAQLAALGCGASSLLGRPYSLDNLRKHLIKLAKAVPGLRKLRQAAGQVDTSSFDEALATCGLLLRSGRNPEDYFKAGMKSLAEKRWDVAIMAFERALSDAQIRAEAQLGLAAAYKGKGDIARFKLWLARASDTFVAARRWNRARSAYARLLQHDPSARNPFLAAAHKLIREKAYDEAAAVLTQSLSLLPKMKAGERYARVCMSADDPEEMFASLEANLASNGNYSFMAREIRESLDVMTKQREQRQKQLAAERKWELAQNMARMKEARAAQADKPEPKPAVLGRAKPGIELAPDFEQARVLAPLGDEGAADELFAEKPRLNEFFSVIKLTWKLARSKKAG
ncbi:MAG: response regulator [Desulfovibrio sp.]|nr:response regulator [Desulfovibrio sp.]